MKILLGIVIVVVVGLTCALQLHAETVHSSDLGWKEGEDITAKLKSLLSTKGVKAGDELVLDHMYRISGTYQMPDDFTLSAKKGAGFEVTDAKDNGGEAPSALEERRLWRGLSQEGRTHEVDPPEGRL